MANLSRPELAEITNTSLPPASLDALRSLRNKACESSQGGFKLQSQQKFLRRILSPESPNRSLLMVHGTGTGKCHGVDTPIMLYDGTIKKVQDIVQGDMLMGDDSTPRRVLSLARGRDDMFKIISKKGESYVVNSEHILCLQHTSTRNQITEITVQDYLKLSKKLRRDLKGYRVPVNFNHKDIDFDPYILGVWLGDGSKRDPVISSQDSVILKYIHDFCKNNNAVLTFQSGYDYRISAICKQFPNVFLEFLKKYNLINNKHVPDDYKYTSRDVRLQVLAGLIDTDGFLDNGTYEITQKSKQLADDIVYLSRSLGFAVSNKLVQKSCMYKGERSVGNYYRIHISGEIQQIPVKILRKQASSRRQIKDVLRYGITIEPLGEGDYYGFMLDGNSRYLLGDFTVTHNTCTAIQIAEEYILRPEFQDQKVLVVASAAVQDNFQVQLFDMSRVNIDLIAGTLESKQCTGRRYLDMLLRIENEPKNWNNPDTRDKLDRISKKIIDEFYEFMAYGSFGNYINEKQTSMKKTDFDQWVHETFDNRLVIIDEAHNIGESKDSEGVKGITSAMETLVKTANGLVLVLLTATPMFDTYDEIMFYFNLFLWNERKQDFKKSLKASDFFNGDGTLRGSGEEFRKMCQDYVSYVKGDNPFTFPFRLPPPKTITETLKTGFTGKAIGPDDRLKYLTLVGSQVAGIQKSILTKEEREDTEERKRQLMLSTIAVLPGHKTFNQCFSLDGKQFRYIDEPFLTPEKIGEHAAKFSTIIKSIEAGEGIALVYSNYVELGSRLFSMALEEHGYTPAFGQTLLAEPSYKGPSKGKYALLSSGSSEAEISAMIERAKNKKNRDGADIRIIISSKIVSEGVDFRYVRQIHIIDPWWNMSRIEQVVGRGLRTCSHQLLPFEKQNCTVYFHVCRTDDGKECYDEYTYRFRVEPKAMRIARVRKVLAESAMDCPLQNQINTLPDDWKNLPVAQTRSEGNQVVNYRLAAMLGPTFDDTPDVAECIVKPVPEDPDHVRPLSTYLDVRDELLSKAAQLFIDKPIWDRDQLLAAMKPYTKEVVIYNLQHAITSGFRFKDAFNRPAVLESKGDLYALSPLNGTMVERTTKPMPKGRVELPSAQVEEEEEKTELADDILATKRASVKLPGDAATRFSEETINGYVFDHEFTDAEKRMYLKSKAGGTPFAERLYVPESEYIVLGHETFEPPEPPVGDDQTHFREWNAALLARFIENKDKLFASLNSSKKFTISKMNIDGENVKRKRDKSFKKFEPIVCGTGDNDKPTMVAFAKFIDKNGVGIPSNITRVPDICIYTELLAREEYNCFWMTPEELSVLYDSKENKAAFTKEFKS